MVNTSASQVKAASRQKIKEFIGMSVLSEIII
jgi:hypothetical protein